MEFGLGIPTRGPLADRAGIEAIATRAETLGFCWLAVPDHLIVPRAIDSRYPYSDSGAFPGAATGECMEQFTLLAFLAAITSRARLLTSVTVVPHRGAIETAKLVSTIDNLSGGRFTFGSARDGWRRSSRRSRLRRSRPAARSPTRSSKRAACSGTTTLPSTTANSSNSRTSRSSPNPCSGPACRCGSGARATRRCGARCGSATPGSRSTPIRAIRSTPRPGSATACGAFMRSPSSTAATRTASVSQCGRIPTTRPARSNGSTASTTSSPAGRGALVDDIGTLAEIGVEQVLLNFQRPDLERSVESMQWFADEVMAKVP